MHGEHLARTLYAVALALSAAQSASAQNQFGEAMPEPNYSTSESSDTYNTNYRNGGTSEHSRSGGSRSYPTIRFRPFNARD
jgi:hypothetical protein